MQGLRRTRTVVGLDSGSGAIKLVALARGKMRSSAFALLPQGEASRTSARVEALRNALQELAPRTTRAVVGLDYSQTIAHRFALPAVLPEGEIEEQASLQAGQASACPVDEICYDYVPEGKAGASVNYRMAVARIRAVRALCDVVEEAGMRVAAVDVTAFAVQRVLLNSRPEAAPLLVLDGGHRRTSVTMYAAGDIAFHHSQPFGCSELAERLQSAYGLSPKDTLKAVEECSRPGAASSRIRDAFLADLARHARRAMQLCLDSRRDAPGPERVLVWGGCAMLHGVCGVLRESLGLPVDRADPCRDLGAGAPVFSPALLGAFALALNDHA